MGIAYLTVDHVSDRIDKFLTGGGDTYQIDKALDCFRAGGFFGVGPGEGQMKFRLPEPQTDYIFSVIGEEFGMIACLVIAGLYIAIVVRVFLMLLDEEDPFVVLAAGGLATQFGLQATINMAVNLKLMPSKGMTLPFISHGGSSFLALCLGMGLLLALTRRNPFLKASPYVERWRAG
jgi:cell division protein FtsW